jgi:hypothetical protein
MNNDKISNIDKRAAYMRHQTEEDNDTKVKSSALNSVKIFNNLSGEPNGPNKYSSGAKTTFDMEQEPVYITHITTSKDVVGVYDKLKTKMIKEFEDTLKTNE